MKFEAARIHFFGDVFDAYSSLLSKEEFFGDPPLHPIFFACPPPTPWWKMNGPQKRWSDGIFALILI